MPDLPDPYKLWELHYIVHPYEHFDLLQAHEEIKSCLAKLREIDQELEDISNETLTKVLKIFGDSTTVGGGFVSLLWAKVGFPVYVASLLILGAAGSKTKKQRNHIEKLSLLRNLYFSRLENVAEHARNLARQNRE